MQVSHGLGALCIGEESLEQGVFHLLRCVLSDASARVDGCHNRSIYFLQIYFKFSKTENFVGKFLEEISQKSFFSRKYIVALQLVGASCLTRDPFPVSRFMSGLACRSRFMGFPMGWMD